MCRLQDTCEVSGINRHSLEMLVNLHEHLHGYDLLCATIVSVRLGVLHKANMPPIHRDRGIKQYDEG